MKQFKEAIARIMPNHYPLISHRDKNHIVITASLLGSAESLVKRILLISITLLCESQAIFIRK